MSGASVKRTTIGYEKKPKRFHAEVKEANKVWGNKVKELSKEDRESKIAAVLGQLNGIVDQVATKHDASRVLQTAIKYGSPEQRSSIATALAGHIVFLATNNYGHHIIIKLVVYGDSAIRSAIYKEMQSAVKKLAFHKDGCKVLDYFWREAANEKLRQMLLRPFYGRAYELGLVGTDDMMDQPLGVVLSATPDKRAEVLGNMATAIAKFLEKGMVGMAIVHRLIRLYLEEAAEEQRQTILGELRDHVLLLAQTIDGAQAVCRLMALGSAKDRKLMIRCFKDHIVEMAVDDAGYLALLAALRYTDDTVMLGKLLVGELVADLRTVLFHDKGVKVLLFLCAGLVKKYNTETETAMLSLDNATTKKDMDVRVAELSTAFHKALCPYLLENLDEALTTKGASDVVVETANRNPAWRQELTQALGSCPLVLGHPIGHKACKRILRDTCSSQPELLAAWEETITAHWTSLVDTHAAWLMLVLLEHGASDTFKAQVARKRPESSLKVWTLIDAAQSK